MMISTHMRWGEKMYNETRAVLDINLEDKLRESGIGVGQR